jgi:glycosyltransferase involved in cell wall biosynthesis
MRIALLHYSAPPVIGGVESILAAQARLFRAAGHEVRVIARRGEPDIAIRGKEPERELTAAIAGCEIVIAHNVLTMPFDMALTDALWRLAKAEWRLAKAEWRLAKAERSIRWIAWVHDLAAANPDYDHPWHLPPWDQLTKCSPDFSYVAVSEARARQFSALTRGKARIIPNGVYTAEVLGLTPHVAAFCEARELLERDIVLLHPTRLLRRKNVEFGIEIVHALRQRGRDAVTLITAAADPHNAQSAAYATALRQHRDALGLDDAVFFVSDAFAVSDADLAALYRVADGLLFPSRQEGFGLPVIEASLHRLPVFCADVEPMNTLVAPPVHTFDPEMAPEEVATLIERTLDRSTPHRARRHVLRNYTWDVIWRDHLAPLIECGGSR